MVSHDRRFNVTARPWAFLYHPLLGQSSSHEGPTGAFGSCGTRIGRYGKAQGLRYLGSPTGRARMVRREFRMNRRPLNVAFVVSRTARAPDHTGPPRRAAGGTEYLWSDWEFPFRLFSM